MWSLCHLFSFAQLPGPVLEAPVERMTKPYFSTFIESICDGLVFISASEDKLSHSVWFSQCPSDLSCKIENQQTDLRKDQEAYSGSFCGFSDQWHARAWKCGKTVVRFGNSLKVTQIWLVTRKILEGFIGLTKLHLRQKICIQNECRDSENQNLNSIKTFLGLCYDNTTSTDSVTVLHQNRDRDKLVPTNASGEDGEGTMPCEQWLKKLVMFQTWEGQENCLQQFKHCQVKVELNLSL